MIFAHMAATSDILTARVEHAFVCTQVAALFNIASALAPIDEVSLRRANYCRGIFYPRILFLFLHYIVLLL